MRFHGTGKSKINNDTVVQYTKKIILVSRTLIKNYQGPGYVYDVVEATLTANNMSVSITASDMTVSGYEEYYVETFTCGFDIASGAMRFYKY